MAPTNAAFITVTDYEFFPGTLATVNSIREFHPDTVIYVVVNEKRRLSEPQLDCLRKADNVRIVSSNALSRDGRFINAWELKAYAAHDLAEEHEVVVGIDSDCILCAPVDDQIEKCRVTGGFIGGKDGDGAAYDCSYEVYGIKAPVVNPKYMSAAVYFFAVNEANRRTTKRWAECCSAAVFNRTGQYPGHGDQGVLNAILYAEDQSERVELLENQLWSQHWVYWKTVTDLVNGSLINRTAEGRPQRSFHCGGAEKFWFAEHRDRVLNGNALQVYPYVWFLAMLWFGKYRNWGVDPFQWLPPRSHHLLQDLINFLPQVFQVLPRSRQMWNEVTDQMINRASSGVHRAMSLGGGSLSDVFELLVKNPKIRRYVEVGSYEGGSLLALAMRFANRDLDFYSVESFMGNLNGTMDGHRLPIRQAFLGNLTKFPGLRARLIPGQSVNAAQLFDDNSVDCVFIDACHDTDAVLADIDTWIKKIGPGGILAGDDFRWESVRRAVHDRIGEVQATPSGDVWWTRVK